MPGEHARAGRTRRSPTSKLLQTYGLTELGILRSQSREPDSLWVRVGGEGFETKIVDGRLWIRAESAMLGYLNAPSPFDADGFFDTGDLVEVDGEWIRILGRESEIINVGGSKVYPAEVESVLLELDERRGRRGRAASRTRSPARSSSPPSGSPSRTSRRRVQDADARVLPRPAGPYKIPAKVRFADDAALRAVQEGPPTAAPTAPRARPDGVRRQPIKRVVDAAASCRRRCRRRCAPSRRRSARPATASSRSGRRASRCCPGCPACSLRRAFYRLTLDDCADASSSVSARSSRTASRASSRASTSAPTRSSGRRGCAAAASSAAAPASSAAPSMHELDSQGRWTPTDSGASCRSRSAQHAWIGEGAIVMADVGASAMVAAGAVVSSRVPAGVVVAGNPARFVRGASTAGPARREPAVRPKAYPFIDWMKAVGMSLIVYGHVAHGDPVPADAADLPEAARRRLLPVRHRLHAGPRDGERRRGGRSTGCSRCCCSASRSPLLADDARRRSPAAAARRATTCRCRRAERHRQQLPGEPDHLVIGTYIHLLLIWAVWLRRVRVRMWMVLAALALEVPVRALSDGVGRPVRRLHALHQLGGGVPARHGARIGRCSAP